MHFTNKGPTAIYVDGIRLEPGEFIEYTEDLSFDDREELKLARELMRTAERNYLLGDEELQENIDKPRAAAAGSYVAALSQEILGLRIALMMQRENLDISPTAKTVWKYIKDLQAQLKAAKRGK